MLVLNNWDLVYKEPFHLFFLCKLALYLQILVLAVHIEIEPHRGHLHSQSLALLVWTEIKHKTSLCIYPQYRDRQAWANSVDSDLMLQNMASNQGIHHLSLIQQYLWHINRYLDEHIQILKVWQGEKLSKYLLLLLPLLVILSYKVVTLDIRTDLPVQQYKSRSNCSILICLHYLPTFWYIIIVFFLLLLMVLTLSTLE